MRVTYDAAKRDATLAERGLDFEDAAAGFSGDHFTFPDDRKDYGEASFITAGYLGGRLVWTRRDRSRRIISMRHAHGKEERRWIKYFG